MRLPFMLIVVLSLVGCEAPEDPPGQNPPEEIPSTFQSISTKILGPKCIQCHSGSKAPDSIDLSSYEGVIANVKKTVVSPGQPLKSKLYISVKEGYMPKGSGRLTSEAVQAIFDWIEKGAPNDGDSKFPEDSSPETAPEIPHEVWPNNRDD